MTTKCGVKFEKLENKKPYERFDYIRRHLIRLLKEKNQNANHLEMASVKKALEVPSKVLSQIKAGVRTDFELLSKLAKIIGEDVSVLIGTQPTASVVPIEQLSKEVDKKSANKEEEKVKREPKKEYTFENHTDSHLGLYIHDGIIRIYFNEQAPKEVKTVLLSRQYVKIGGKDEERIFPEVIKL